MWLAIIFQDPFHRISVLEKNCGLSLIAMKFVALNLVLVAVMRPLQLIFLLLVVPSLVHGARQVVNRQQQHGGYAAWRGGDRRGFSRRAAAAYAGGERDAPGSGDVRADLCRS